VTTFNPTSEAGSGQTTRRAQVRKKNALSVVSLTSRIERVPPSHVLLVRHAARGRSSSRCCRRSRSCSGSFATGRRRRCFARRQRSRETRTGVLVRLRNGVSKRDELARLSDPRARIRRKGVTHLVLIRVLLLLFHSHSHARSRRRSPTAIPLRPTTAIPIRSRGNEPTTTMSAMEVLRRSLLHRFGVLFPDHLQQVFGEFERLFDLLRFRATVRPGSESVSRRGLVPCECCKGREGERERTQR
jgi:hypothetical protein